MTLAASNRFVWWAALAGCLLGTLPSGSVVAEDACADCQRDENHRRAGYPQSVKHLAAPSNTRFYGWYYVGGGDALWRGEPRLANEGTFGWDYSGILFPKQVALAWSHGRRYQGGTGAYRTVGLAPLKTQ